ncbi:anti-anti-sigma factor [Moorena producens PAL-8-15-08-1]|uniref:Anti-anti-sigma factor n=1 Tax=Moorena producens PAL-8-15-08-1 TaxID=1458985 RepID=A0A1D8U3A0_9CYAN|nr:MULTISPECIES: sugar transferase [Moorena]AOX04381.1 anti-anti-sigma factor [Moorena producens PAL-8-15-08-1]NEO78741.1 STAS domain-containing protein [Moorena sp. SIO4G3]
MVDSVKNHNFQVIFSQDAPVVELPTRVSVLEAVEFKQLFQQLLQKIPLPETIIFDFHQTTFIDSSGIGALVSNHKSALEQGVKTLLKNVTPQVMSVLVMTGLDQRLAIEASDNNTTRNTNKSVNHLPTTHPSVRSPVKRLIDIVGAIVGLGITAVLFIPLALAIKLDSPGPIFFAQIRCGWMGKRFRIWKFRSMCANAEQLKKKVKNQADGKVFKNENDPRITRVGHFLRKTSLDELPQFWNVLKGEMSLVGTRPPTVNEVEIYEVPEWQRLNVKPGITGEWQVNGRSKIRSFEDIIQMDLKYQHHWSLAHDIRLIFKTILVVLRKDGM